MAWQAWDFSTSNSILIDGANIYAGSILGSCIAANTITGNNIKAGSIDVSNLNFTPLASTNVIACINASAEALRISGTKININGDVIFDPGYSPTDVVGSIKTLYGASADQTKIDGGKIYTGSILADSLAAGSVTAEKLTVGATTRVNLCANGHFGTSSTYGTSIGGWSLGSGVSFGAAGGTYAVKNAGTINVPSFTTTATAAVLAEQYITVMPGNTYTVVGLLYLGNGATSASLRVLSADGSTRLSTQGTGVVAGASVPNFYAAANYVSTASDTAATTGAWQLVAYKITAPAGATQVRLQVVLEAGSGTSVVYATGIQLYADTVNEAGTTLDGISYLKGIAYGGDVSGNYSALSVRALQGRLVSSAAPSDTQVLSWSTSSSAWLPSSLEQLLAGKSISAVSFAGAGTGLTGTASNLTVGNAAYATTAGASSLLATGTSYSKKLADTPDSYGAGVSISFVQGTDGWDSYGTILTARGYDAAGGGTVQFYAPYGTSYGGNYLRYRLADYNGGAPVWKNFKTIIDSDNIGAQSVTYATTAGSATTAAQLTGAARTNGADGWFRSTGGCGWYNETYGTGIRSLGANQVRTYNGNDFYSEGALGAAGACSAAGFISTPVILDLTALDASKWFPVTIQIPTWHTVRMRVEAALDMGPVPSWSTHSAGYSVICDWSSNGSGWGTQAVARTIHTNIQNFSSVPIVGGIEQLRNGSIEYIYLRGGGKYRFESDYPVTPTVQSATFTNSNESVSPITAVINDVWSSATCNTAFGDVRSIGAFYGAGTGLTGTASGLTAGAANSVAWSNVSGKPNVSALNFQWNWSGQSGTPTWLWGGFDGSNMYLYSPANMSVNYATSAGNASTVSTITAAQVFNAIAFANNQDWYRTTGERGVYFSSYASGLWATATQYLQTYNGSSLQVNGALVATGNVTAYYSDARLKENIKVIPHALDKVLALRGVTFNANAKAVEVGYTDTSEQVGVLAQEVQTVLPQVVAFAPFDREVEADGKTSHSKSGEDYLTVRYDRMVPLLIEAIKELNHKLEGLR